MDTTTFRGSDIPADGSERELVQLAGIMSPGFQAIIAVIKVLKVFIIIESLLSERAKAPEG